MLDPEVKNARKLKSPKSIKVDKENDREKKIKAIPKKKARRSKEDVYD